MKLAKSIVCALVSIGLAVSSFAGDKGNGKEGKEKGASEKSASEKNGAEKSHEKSGSEKSADRCVERNYNAERNRGTEHNEALDRAREVCEKQKQDNKNK